jgi:hypothetical protein
MTDKWQTRPWLTNDRPDLSSERAPQIRQDCNFQKKKKSKISGQKSQIGHDTKTYWLTVSCNETLTLTDWLTDLYK